MIIDFHTHCFPDKVAVKAIPKLAAASDTHPYSDGTLDGLRRSNIASGVDYAVVMPVATSARQVPSVNRTAIEINSHSRETGIFSFGAIHPECENYRAVIKNLSERGIKGLKLHPVYQQYAINDLHFLRIIECACEYGLWILTHAGYDIGIPGAELSSVEAINDMIQILHPDRLILAHMGGWGQWDEAEEKLLSYPIWMDTSTCLISMEHYEQDPLKRKFPPEKEQMPREQFVRMVRKLGSDRILMGSDLPWTRQTDAIRAVLNSGLNKEEIDNILGKNAAGILFS